jgi:hypothetical protein
MKTLIALAALSAFATSPRTIPEHIENLKWEATKVPVLDESKPTEKFSVPAWEKVQKAKGPVCGKSPVWRVSPESQVEAIATKEKTINVKGKFSRFWAFAEESNQTLTGNGFIDLTSWDSGLAPRDYRVIKYVFGAEKKGASVLPFRFVVARWNTLQESSESSLQLQFTLRGTAIHQTLPVRIEKQKNGLWKIDTIAPKRFVFLSAANLPSFSQLLELCNHQFLASFADIQLSLLLENPCQH